MAAKRIQKELAEVMATPPKDTAITLPESSTLNTWHITLRGPASTAYQGGTFGLVLTLPDSYPFKPPVLKFITRIYHPNVTNDNMGNICLGILKPENWKPSSKLSGVLEAVRGLLVEPMPEDPLEPRIADEYMNERAEFEKNVRLYVERYAKGAPRFEGGS